jgi:cyanophycin synthetase
LLRATSLGPTTRSLVEEAERRGIPVARLDEQSLVQLGYGSSQQRLRASITGKTSQIAVDLAGNKNLTKKLLAAAGLPVPAGVVVRSADDSAAEATKLGYPVVVKPLDGNHGRGVSVNLQSPEQVRTAFALAAAHSRRVIVERQLPGNDHRILVVGGKVVAVAERVPARVIGDGIHSISELIDITNDDSRRGEGHEKVLTKIRIDAHLLDMLARQSRSLEMVPPMGEASRASRHCKPLHGRHLGGSNGRDPFGQRGHC